MHSKFMLKNYSSIAFALIIILFSSDFYFSQTTGKLTGRVTDENGEPLIGANILVREINTGAATDVEGYYTILNLRADNYDVEYRFVGYQTKVVEGIRINGDKTTEISVQLFPQAVEGEEVVVTAQKPIVEFNVTSSVSTVTTEDIDNLPVQSLDEIVNLQAGVIDGHFRGGRLGEVQYQVDGVTVNNPYDNSSTLRLDRSIIEEVQVISGTFDAKYGQAMSGVVNAILKTGDENFEWSGEVYGGDYIPFDKSRYPNNDDLKPQTIQNYQLTLSGPTPIPKTTFLLSGRRFVNDGYLFGENRFVPTDSNDFQTPEFFPTGNGELIAMKTNETWSGQAKLTTKAFQNFQISYQAIVNDVKGSSYNNAYRLNPTGIKEQNTFSITHGLDFTHTLTNVMYYNLSFRQNFFEYTDYKYEDLYDPRYLEAGAPRSSANYEDGAIVQGVDLGRFKQRTDAFIAKAQYTWQFDRKNLLEAGVEFQTFEILFGSPGFYSDVVVDGVQVLIPQIGTLPSDQKIEVYYPKEYAAYLQDRIEVGDIIVRAGARFQMFDANSSIPGDLRNPANSIRGVPSSENVNTDIKYSLSPRLGLSFPLTAAANVYFSYGHFYQMPNLQHLYNNSNYLVLENLQAGITRFGTLGNPNLKPQLTVQYEVGLKQALTNYLGLQLTFFYKDIRDLLGAEFISTYNAAEYVRFTNIDFGSSYGFTVVLDQRAIGPISTSLDYTLQFANGNSSDPNETANRAEAGKDPRPRDIPFNWDQRHTLNATAVFSDRENYSISAILKYGSGQPYTPALGTGFNADLETNSGRKESFIILDMRAEKFFNFSFSRLSLFVRAFNLLNTFSSNGFVFNTTGSADYSQFPYLDRVALNNPGRFYEPRRIEIGFSIRSN